MFIIILNSIAIGILGMAIPIVFMTDHSLYGYIGIVILIMNIIFIIINVSVYRTKCERCEW